MSDLKETQRKVNRKFRKLSIQERLHTMHDAGYLSEDSLNSWLTNAHGLDATSAERMIENVIGTFTLPEGIAINFPVNGKNYLVPLVVEEPSVVAALSYAGLLAEKSGGFTASHSGSILAGQIQLVDVPDIDSAITAIETKQEDILNAADTLMPNMVARGGGAKSLSVYKVTGPHTQADMLVVKISINTCDAMGANMVNAVCEGLAPKLESLTQGRALLKILSNLADESVATASVTFTPKQLALKDISGEQVVSDIVLANDLALADPYRATTHNKGIMNGIDPVAIATGNDWRSIEAAAHAYAARDGQYKALTRWTQDEQGNLKGEINIPIKVGTVGASLQTNPVVSENQKILGIESASELAQIMAAVGLAQNFAALRALVTAGIQKGHMTLHARSVALTAKIPEVHFDAVVKALVDSGEIKVWKAEEILATLVSES